jgi:hypothetical protein
MGGGSSKETQANTQQTSNTQASFRDIGLTGSDAVSLAQTLAVLQTQQQTQNSADLRSLLNTSQNVSMMSLQGQQMASQQALLVAANVANHATEVAEKAAELAGSSTTVNQGGSIPPMVMIAVLAAATLIAIKR